MPNLHRVAIAAAAIAVPVIIAGCEASANLTVSPDTIATQAAEALQEQVGTAEPPKMDCGEDQVDLVDGTEVACVLTDPESGNEYDATVTLSDVDGTEYHIDVQVAETPRS